MFGGPGGGVEASGAAGKGAVGAPPQAARSPSRVPTKSRDRIVQLLGDIRPEERVLLAAEDQHRGFHAGDYPEPSPSVGSAGMQATANPAIFKAYDIRGLYGAD